MDAVQDLIDPRVAAPVRAYFETLSRDDEAAWRALFADDAVVHQPVGTVAAEGLCGLREMWRMLTGPFEQLAVSEDAVFYGGSGAAAKWTCRGKGATGREVRFEGINVFEIGLDGRIQTLMAYWDPAAVLIELAGD